MKEYVLKIWSTVKYCWLWYMAQFKGVWYQRIITPIATLIVLFFLYLGAVDMNFMGLFGLSPTMDCIENPVNSEASMIYSSDSVLIGKFFSENRSPVAFEEISPYVINALISTEDERFYVHHGIDYQGLFSAAKDISQGNARGASTITQQLVKNLFKIRSQYSTGILGKIPVLRILIMKSKEWITAIKIENLYSKKDILTLYLNTVDFGSNSYGIRTAARTYFDTEPKNLTAEQAATLVGLLKATTTYNPKINPKNSFARRNVVLDNMLSHNGMFTEGRMTKREHDSLVKIPINISHFKVEKAYDGKSQYFRQAVREYLRDWCKANEVDLYGDGLKIYTTIDTRMQAYAEWAVNKQMKSLQKKFDNHWLGMNPWRDERHQEIPDFIEGIARRTSYYQLLNKKYDGNSDSIDYYMNLPHKVKVFAYGKDGVNGTIEKEMSTMDSIRYMVRFLHCGFVAMEPQTSFVKAWVGDVDFNSWKYDKVTAMRQPGSTFKLFVYASAFENNDSITPMSRRLDSYISLRVPDSRDTTKLVTWTPHNANGYCTNGNMPLKSAFAQSVNTIAVKLGQETGIENVVNIAHKMGIHSPLDPTPALALGSSDVNLLELVDAYASVMNDGMHRDPILVTKIVDREGEVIYDYEEEVAKAERAMKYKTAFYMQRLFWEGLHDRWGTTAALWQYIHPVLKGNDFGGKTGTSSNHSDAWFVGCTPNLVGGAWVGGEYRCIHFRTGELGQGSRTSLPIFGYFISKVLKDPKFQKYGGMYPEAKEDIKRNTYIGPGYVHVPDSLNEDSIEANTELVIHRHSEQTQPAVSNEN
ncbi:MAG: penicillin-binding protein [Bacteroidaceae bacterium]|nr:penicillin-binding protein [Bacteroidaceae bacterium]